jgi:hypothetical protein
MRFSLLAGGAALLVIAAGGAAAFTLYTFNHFRDVEDRFAGSCAPVTGVAGPEDIEAPQASGRAFVSSLDRRAGPDARVSQFVKWALEPLKTATN